jgi:hypothetical protein
MKVICRRGHVLPNSSDFLSYIAPEEVTTAA